MTNDPLTRDSGYAVLRTRDAGEVLRSLSLPARPVRAYLMDAARIDMAHDGISCDVEWTDCPPDLWTALDAMTERHIAADLTPND